MNKSSVRNKEKNYQYCYLVEMRFYGPASTIMVMSSTASLFNYVVSGQA